LLMLLIVLRRRPEVAVDDGRQVAEALPGRQIGDVPDELGARCVGGEVAAHPVGDVHFKRDLIGSAIRNVGGTPGRNRPGRAGGGRCWPIPPTAPVRHWLRCTTPGIPRSSNRGRYARRSRAGSASMTSPSSSPPMTSPDSRPAPTVSPGRSPRPATSPSARPVGAAHYGHGAPPTRPGGR